MLFMISILESSNRIKLSSYLLIEARGTSAGGRAPAPGARHRRGRRRGDQQNGWTREAAAREPWDALGPLSAEPACAAAGLLFDDRPHPHSRGNQVFLHADTCRRQIPDLLGGDSSRAQITSNSARPHHSDPVRRVGVRKIASHGAIPAREKQRSHLFARSAG